MDKSGLRDRQCRLRRWERDLEDDGIIEASYDLTWDREGRVTRMTRDHGRHSERDMEYYAIEYDCRAPPGPVRTANAVLFCNGARDCPGGQRCFHDRGNSRDVTYCSGGELNAAIELVER